MPDDLRRFVTLDRAWANCSACTWRLTDRKPETTKANARTHTRETGHPTEVTQRHVTSYYRIGADDD